MTVGESFQQHPWPYSHPEESGRLNSVPATPDFPNEDSPSWYAYNRLIVVYLDDLTTRNPVWHPVPAEG